MPSACIENSRIGPCENLPILTRVTAGNPIWDSSLARSNRKDVDSLRGKDQDLLDGLIVSMCFPLFADMFAFSVPPCLA